MLKQFLENIRKEIPEGIKIEISLDERWGMPDEDPLQFQSVWTEFNCKEFEEDKYKDVKVCRDIAGRFIQPNPIGRERIEECEFMRNVYDPSVSYKDTKKITFFYPNNLLTIPYGNNVVICYRGIITQVVYSYHPLHKGERMSMQFVFRTEQSNQQPKGKNTNA